MRALHGASGVSSAAGSTRSWTPSRQVDGLTGGHGGSAPAGNGSMADQLVSSALRYRAQSPLVDSLLAEIGLNGGDLNGLTKALEAHAGRANGGAPAASAAGAIAKATLRADKLPSAKVDE